MNVVNSPFMLSEYDIFCFTINLQMAGLIDKTNDSRWVNKGRYPEHSYRKPLSHFDE